MSTMRTKRRIVQKLIQAKNPPLTEPVALAENISQDTVSKVKSQESPTQADGRKLDQNHAL